MPFCRECMKLEDALEAATLDYDELLIQHKQLPDDTKLTQLREQRQALTKQLADHQGTHAATA